MIQIQRRQASTSVAAAMLFGLFAASTLPSAAMTPSAATLQSSSSSASSADVDPALRADLARGRAAAVVRTVEGRTDVVQAAVLAAGGEVTADLPLIDGFAALIDASLLEQLAVRDDVIALTADHAATFQGSSAVALGGDDFFEETIGATTLWGAGVTGDGVGIAVLDTGAASVSTVAGRVRPGVDVTSDQDGVDHVGHGTFLAGLAAGDGAGSPNGDYEGVAPGAHIIPVKVGSDNGVSLIGLLEGLQWVHHHRDVADIDVVNLSFGTTSPQSVTIDPLNFAVQQLWSDGLVVVVAAGNLGDQGPSSITKPGDDPFVITVGSTDSRGTVARGDDTVPSFSSTGPTLADGIAKPDIVAPGRSLVGPIAPGSAVDSMTVAHIGQGWVRASGTSFSTAVVSGAVALLLEAHPTWTPDQVKGALLDSAAPGPVGDPNVDGHGALDIAAAALVTNPSNPNAGIPFGTGTGSLEATLGDVATALSAAADLLPDTVGVTVDVRTCLLGICKTVAVEVEVPIGDLAFFDEATYLADWAADSWQDTQWYGHQWYGHQWYGHQWYGHQWYGHQWYGHQWYGHQWYGHQWYGHQWYGHQWYGNDWD